MATKIVKSIPMCTNLIVSLSIIISRAELNPERTKIINCEIRKTGSSAINVFFDEKTKVKGDCFRFFSNLNFFRIEKQEVLVLEDGLVLINNPDDYDLWYQKICEKMWQNYKMQIKAIFRVMKTLHENNEQLYKKKIQEKFYDEYKNKPAFLKKDGSQRNKKHMFKKADGILSILKKVKVLTDKKIKGSSFIFEINYENLSKFFPKLDLFKKKEKAIEFKIESWDYSSFIKILLENFDELPSDGEYHFKGVDYYELRENCIKSLSEIKKLDNPYFIFDKSIEKIDELYRRDFVVRSYIDKRKILYINHPNIENYTRKIPKNF